MRAKKSVLFGFAGLLFSISGLVWVLSGNIPIGMMNVCIGMMFVTFSAAARRREGNQPTDPFKPSPDGQEDRGEQTLGGGK